MDRIAVLGAGSWGTALAIILAKRGYDVKLWARKARIVAEINEQKINSRYLQGVNIPPKVEATVDLAEALKDSPVVVLAVPSHAMRETVRAIRPLIHEKAYLVNTAKGLENDTLLRMSQVIASELPESMHQQVATLSGPSHAEEVSRDIPSTIVVAARQRATAELIQDVFMSPFFRVYTNPDLTGVELGGSLKNVIALATGISDGLGFGDNTKAAIMTRGLAEITRLGVAMGAKALTFAGLAGIGDLIVTCTSMHSRNRRAGIQLGQGKPLDIVLEEMGMVVEGVRTTKAAYALAREYGVEMPITNQVYQVLFEGQEPRSSVARLMQRSRTHEVEEVVMNWEDW